MIAFARQPARMRSATWQQHFEQLLPAIHRAARFAFRKLPLAEREEAHCEVVANAFCAYRRLVQLNKVELAYAGPLARYAIAQYRSGRRVGSSLSKRDVLASVERGHRRRTVESLDQIPRDVDWRESLVDDRHWPVSEQAAFRVDFPAWLEQLSPRDRRLIQFLSLGHRPQETAARFRLSAGRISQLRGEWQASWEAFHALPAPA